ncbi:MAG: DUF721 domain-containing protein [Fusobacteriaceae bacterium]|jgi:hypothetical protein|nr:DUF721 domain-containing protein [Fusobacteriaceae bacterium]
MDEITPVGDLLLAWLRRDKKMQAGYIRAHWASVAGELAEYSRVSTLRGDTLHVLVDNPTILHFMTMNGPDYLEKIKTLFGELDKSGEIAVNRLKFQLRA